MRKYIVFKFDHYYPNGGWNDFCGIFDTLQEARVSVSDYQHYQIVDSLSYAIVEEK